MVSDVQVLEFVPKYWIL